MVWVVVGIGYSELRMVDVVATLRASCVRSPTAAPNERDLTSGTRSR